MGQTEPDPARCSPAVNTSFAHELACPSCGTDVRPADEALVCDACMTWYPVIAGIPILLDFRLPLHEAGDAPQGYGPPRGEPRPGELSAQETFSEEWGAVTDSELSFTYSVDELVELNRRVWLKGIDSGVRRVLDVGCGLGRETLALRSATGAEEVVGVDLNLALLNSPEARHAPPGTHFAVASVFALPFRPGSFDLVHSQGVLHHTYSTERAFRAVAPLVSDGGHLFVWLYGLEDRLATKGRRRVAMNGALALERVFRPLVSRSPKPMRDAFFAGATRAAHPLLKPRMRHADRWEPENTDTFLRDLLSPRFAHRHGWNEVIEWFEREGFEVVDVQSPLAYRRLFGQPLWGVGLTGRRTRPSAAVRGS
jgi:SAM-dependent methyltransferase/uncharacterized protein YbaR (Trm112 family)